MCNLFTAYSEFLICHIAKANLGPFETSTMDFFLQKISSYVFSRLLNPPLQLLRHGNVKASNDNSKLRNAFWKDTFLFK